MISVIFKSKMSIIKTITEINIRSLILSLIVPLMFNCIASSCDRPAGKRGLVSSGMSDSTKEIYQDHEIKPFLLEFEDYISETEDDSEDSDTFTEENARSESTCEEELIVTEEIIEDKPLPISQKLLTEVEEKENGTDTQRNRNAGAFGFPSGAGRADLH